MEYTPALPPNAARYDGFGEVLADIGNTRQYGNAIVSLGGAFGARVVYAQGGLAARIVDIPADLSTAKGVTIEHGGEQVANELDRLKVMQCLADALRWALLDGGGALLVLSKDAGRLEDPLRDVLEIEEFRVLSIVDMRGDSVGRYNDPALPNYGDPQFYLINGKASTGGSQYRVHESRIIPIPGAPTPTVAGMDARDIPWAGRGLTSKVVQSIERYHRMLRWAEALLERSQQAVHGMKGLADMLMAGQEAVVRKRISMVDSARSAINGVAVDADDTYTITTAPLSGVKDVLQEGQTAVAAETGLPQTLLFGRSPGGLNSTGEGDWDVVYGMVEQLRTRRLDPALERIVALIIAQPSVTEKPEDWRICWNPLAPLDRQQQADVENKEAQTLKTTTEALQAAVNLGAVSEDEAHEFLAAEGLFGLEAPEEAGGAARARRYATQTE